MSFSEYPSTSPWTVVGLTTVVGMAILFFVFLCNLVKKTDKKEEEEVIDDKLKSNQNINSNVKKNKLQQSTMRKKNKKSEGFSHPLLACNLRVHTGQVLAIDFSQNGRYLASCSDDRTILIWNVDEFNKKVHKSARVNVELDHATKIRFSPDCRAFIVSLFSEGTLRVYKITKREESGLGKIRQGFDFTSSPPGTGEIIDIGIASTGKYIMTCHKGTKILIWDLKGEILSTIDTLQINNTHAAVSQCGRFVGSTGFTPDVKVWEVCYDKLGNFKEVVKIYQLMGHTSGVYSFAFSPDSKRMVSVSKDGTLKFWDTDIEYKKQLDPRQLMSIELDFSVPSGSLVAISPDCLTVALATGANLRIYRTDAGKCDCLFENIHPDGVTCLEFSVDSKFVATAGDRSLIIFNNVTGYRALLDDLAKKLLSSKNNTMRERIQEQIDNATSNLKEIEKSSNHS